MDEPVRPTSRKLTHEYIKAFFEFKGCVLLSEYQDSGSHLDYICECGNQSRITFHRFQKGQRCKTCGIKNKNHNGKKLTFEYIQEVFEKAGCKLLETEYTNAKQKLRYLCICGNETTVCFDSFRSGTRCRKCGSKRSAKKQVMKFSSIEDYFKDSSYLLLTTEKDFISCNRSNIQIQCKSCGYIHKKPFNQFKNWIGCLHNELTQNSQFTNKRGRTVGQRPKGQQCYQWREDRDKLTKEKLYKQKCYKMLTYVLKKIKQSKKDKAFILLGYSNVELMNRIENHPNWEKIKGQSWAIDHIIPVQAFLDHGITDVKIINALDNLQPLTQSENSSKGDSYNIEDFKNYLLSKGIKYEPK